MVQLVAKNRCSEDLPDSHSGFASLASLDHVPAQDRSGRRMARRTTIGAWSRINRLHGGRVVQRHVFNLGEKPTPAGSGLAQGRTEVLRDHAGQPQNAGAVSRRSLRRGRGRRFDRAASTVRTAGSAGRGSGARAGCPGSCGESCGWIGSGQIACREAAKARVGIRFCRCWPAIGSLRLAASGNCTANGLAARRWLTCWVRTSDWPNRTNSMPVTIFC